MRIEDLEIGQKLWVFDPDSDKLVWEGEVSRLWKTYKYETQHCSGTLLVTEAEILLDDWTTLDVNEGDGHRLFSSKELAILEATKYVDRERCELERITQHLKDLENVSEG